MDKKITKKELQQIKDCLEAMAAIFSERIAPVYETLNWTWGTQEPPNDEDIRDTFKELIDTLIELTSKDFSEEREVSTGGLKVSYNYSDDECHEVTVGLTDEYTVYPSKIKD